MDHTLDPIIRLTEKCIQETGRAILVLEGMSAAGKSTAAEYLSARWDAPVVHMDDFFLPPALRTPARLSEAGGNVHYERFASEALPALRTGDAFSYRVFDCSVMACGERRIIPAAPVILVEGAYAMHPVFEKYWDVSAFFSVDPEEQRRRIIARGGEETWPMFRDRWIPLENAYHTAFRIQTRADILITTETGCDT